MFEPTSRLAFAEMQVSTLWSHERSCCAVAAAQIRARLAAYPDVASRLAALPGLVVWGPTAWPAHWCELDEDDVYRGDCGVHAHLAAEILTDAGIPHVRARAVIEPALSSSAHWRRRWERAGLDAPWVGDRLVHHEVIGVADRWWDPGEACWFTGVGDHLLAGRVVHVQPFPLR